MNGWGDTMDEAKIKVSSAVDVIFADLEKYHGTRYVVEKLGNFDEESAMKVKADWANEIIRLPKNLVADGLRRARKSQWCPTLAQFISMCLPTAEQAFFEAVAGATERSHGREFEYSCPAVYWAAVEFGGSELRIGDWKKAQYRWLKIWDATLERQSKGLLADVPVVTKQLTNDAPTEYVKPDHERVKAAVSGAFAKRFGSGATAWAMNLKSIAAAERLIHGLIRADTRRLLQPIAEYHLRDTKKLVEVDGRLIVGESKLFYQGVGNGHEQRSMAA